MGQNISDAKYPPQDHQIEAACRSLGIAQHALTMAAQDPGLSAQLTPTIAAINQIVGDLKVTLEQRAKPPAVA